jgi:murein DD-endopeptidase MepM/ murein hydrolase activator NlpD
VPEAARRRRLATTRWPVGPGRLVTPIALGIWLLSAPDGLAQVVDVEVTHLARAVAPGELVVVSISSSPLVAVVEGRIFDRQVRFYQTTDGAWRGLVGVDLAVEPGLHDLALRLISATGRATERVHRLPVADKAYPTRQLRVAPRYVEPPPEVGARIAREAEEQQAIFATSSPERLWQGAWQPPVSGAATSAFGSRSVFNGQPRNPHSGADFRAPEGTPVSAPNVGRVVLTGDTYFSGGSVILDHGWGLYSYFAHLSEILVMEGELVAPGQVIGEAGATGRVTGPHLHWTVRLNGARVDPLSLLDLLQD